jgi:hypothetical protein
VLNWGVHEVGKVTVLEVGEEASWHDLAGRRLYVRVGDIHVQHDTGCVPAWPLARLPANTGRKPIWFILFGSCSKLTANF